MVGVIPVEGVWLTTPANKVYNDIESNGSNWSKSAYFILDWEQEEKFKTTICKGFNSFGKV